MDRGRRAREPGGGASWALPACQPGPLGLGEACLPGQVWGPLSAQQSTGPTCKDVSGPQDGNVLMRAITTAIISHDSSLHGGTVSLLCPEALSGSPRITIW